MRTPTRLPSQPPRVEQSGRGALIVSGPYMIGEWRRGQRFTLVPNPEFDPQPNIPRVVFRVIPEETTRLIEFQTGNADMIVLPFDKLEMVQQSVDDMRLEVREGRFYDYIGYNPHSHPALADPQVRRALGLAIDREGLISALSLDGFARPPGAPSLRSRRCTTTRTSSHLSPTTPPRPPASSMPQDGSRGPTVFAPVTASPSASSSARTPGTSVAPTSLRSSSSSGARSGLKPASRPGRRTPSSTLSIERNSKPPWWAGRSPSSST
jgi:ABC-type oligopeptide transport system substrate-binding subunit